MNTDEILAHEQLMLTRAALMDTGAIDFEDHEPSLPEIASIGIVRPVRIFR